HQEFAAPGKFKELDCKGRLCANCGKCRDWYYKGDLKTWQWIQTAKNGWQSEDVKRWCDGKHWKGFQRRDGYTCTGLHALLSALRRSHLRHYYRRL
ncbi:unnamed protein product, partial [Rotaria sp. Silwood2]